MLVNITGFSKENDLGKKQFKPTKSRPLVLKSGIVIKEFRFKIAGTRIPLLKDKKRTVKCLGKTFNGNLKDIDATQK